MLDQKRLFTRLLAKEDLVVTQSKTAKTASFNVKKRVITFPIYNDMEEINMTGFTCHEVGHALHSGMDVMELFKVYGKSVVNTIEDLRVNNLMKKEFRGISNIFFDHYGSLNNRKFFGEWNRDSGFLDKINIANKLRFNLFSTDDEKIFWKKFAKLETFDELVEACEYVVNVYKDNQEKPESNDPDEIPEDKNTTNPEGQDTDDDPEGQESEAPSMNTPEDETDEDTTDPEGQESETGEDDLEGEESGNESDDGDVDGEESGNESDNGDETDNDSDETGEESDDDSATGGEESDDDPETEGDNSDLDTDTDTDSNDESDDESEGAGDSSPEVADDDFDPDTISCESEDNFEKSLESNIDGSRYGDKTTYVVPRTRDMKSNIIPHKNISFKGHYDVVGDKVNDMEWSEFVKYKKKVVNRMVGAFNRNKAASEWHRRRFTDSGTLNMSKLHQYKTNEDIFLKNMKIAEGKNHGVIFYLDTSGSMRGNNGDYTVRQIAIMTDFCRKLNIPYTVLGFTGHKTNVVAGEDKDAITVGNIFYNIELLSHEQTSSDHENKVYCLWVMLKKNGYNMMNYVFNGETADGSDIKYELSCTGTPLYATMINSIKYIDTFKMSNNVEMVSVMYFTDGVDYSGLVNEQSKRIYFSSVVDAQTKKTYKTMDYKNVASQNTSIMLSNLIKDRFNCNVFFFGIPKSGNSLASDCGIDYYDDKAKALFGRVFRKKTFHKVECKSSGVEQYALYVNADTPTEADFDGVEVETDKNGKVKGTSITKLRRILRASNASQQGSYLFAELVADKVAEGV